MTRNAACCSLNTNIQWISKNHVVKKTFKGHCIATTLHSSIRVHDLWHSFGTKVIQTWICGRSGWPATATHPGHGIGIWFTAHISISHFYISCTSARPTLLQLLISKVASRWGSSPLLAPRSSPLLAPRQFRWKYPEELRQWSMPHALSYSHRHHGKQMSSWTSSLHLTQLVSMLETVAQGLLELLSSSYASALTQEAFFLFK